MAGPEDPLGDALADPGTSAARLRELLAEELRRSAVELEKPRSGRVTVAFGGPDLTASVPADARVRVDPGVVNERTWLIVAAAVGAAVAGGAGDLRAGGDGSLSLGGLGGDPELAALAFDENAAGLDRVRPRALVVPDGLLAPASGPLVNSELKVAEAVARQGANPADPAAVEDLAEVLESGPVRPHEDPDRARRAARRILQRLNGMGKWGGYHTAFDHLARGFAGNERALAYEVGEALLDAGLLAQKPSVGQRHVFLNPRRAAEIHRMIETGDLPPKLTLPS